MTVVHSGRIRVAFVAFAPYSDTASLLDLPGARRLIGRARREADVVVAYMHAGAEGTGAQHVTGQEETYVARIGAIRRRSRKWRWTPAPTW